MSKKAAGDAISDAGSKVGDSLMNAKVAIHEAIKVSSAELALIFRKINCISGSNTVGLRASQKKQGKKNQFMSFLLFFVFSQKDFDSKKLMENKHTVIGNILSKTADQAEKFADNIGFFRAIDSVVHGM